RTPADEIQEPRQHFPDQRALGDVDLALAMNLYRLGLQGGVGAHDRLQTLASQDPVAPDPDRGNRDDVVRVHVEAGGFAIDRDNLVRRPRVEHEPVRLIANRGPMEQAFDRAWDHVRTGRACSGDEPVRETASPPERRPATDRAPCSTEMTAAAAFRRDRPRPPGAWRDAASPHN